MVTHLMTVEIVSIKMLKQNYNAQYYNRPIPGIFNLKYIDIYKRGYINEKQNILLFVKRTHVV